MENRTVLVGNNGRWAKGTTIVEAKRNAKNPQHYNAYSVTPETTVSEHGSLLYPGDAESDAPKLLVKK